MAALDDTETPADGYTAGSYTSSAGTISSAVTTYLVNGASEAGGYDLSALDVVWATVLVTDSAGNTRTFSTPQVVTTPSVALSNSAIPVISGSAVVGQTLSTSGGTWAGSATRTFSYQWTRGGLSIAGATSATYALVDADEATSVACTVTADDGFTQVAASASAVTVSAAAAAPLLAIFAGQSNAAASGTSGESVPARYASLSGVNILNTAGTAWLSYTPGTNANPDGTATLWGPEAEFAYQYRQAFPSRALYIVKLAEGGSSVESGPGTDWDPASANELFETLEDQVTAARGLLDGASVAYQTVSVWNQGEADSKNQTKFDAYYGTDGTDGDWSVFINAWRARIDDTGDFITVRIRPYTGNTSVSWAFQLRELDELWADSNAWFEIIDADFEGTFNSLHPDVDWIDGLGARAFHRWNGTYSANYDELTDVTPTNLTFVDADGQTASATVAVSMTEAITGINRGAAITVTGGEYRTINDLDDTTQIDWTTAAGIVHPYQTIELRGTANATAAGTTDVTVTVGGVSDTWTITTDDGTPVNTVAPAITGTFNTGQTLTVSNGTWTNSPSSYSYQWTRGGADISGATSSTYTLVVADEGSVVDCDVTATNANGSTEQNATGEGTPTSGPTWPAGITDIGTGAWYDGQTSTIVTGGSGSVEDLSTNGYDLSVTSGDVTTTTINGHTALALASDVLSHTSLHTVMPDTGFSFTFYGDVLRTDRNYYLAHLTNGASDNLLAFGHRSNGNYRVITSTGSSSDMGAADTSLHAITWQYDGTDMTLWIDGVDTTESTDVDLSAVTVTEAVIGGLIGGGSTYAGNVGEIIIVARDLTGTEIGDLHTYMANRWAA
jgi:hypothetical protein